eukprot:CAMPEP_0178928394 /NCGR_PEP_ID=MMETSP0786-20121207/19874_1 /TAXON_ID=186022 /ORGANISM="Thalassionema frauenfeldii, Strain CCMP 1798" /LENGTH=283 /DNA_ID=CAMNT_0020604243 /DNA_START=1 /DNA_END=852 /DNA_ORIENTATION=-
MDEDSSEPSLHSSDSDSDSSQGRRCDSIAENVLIHGVRPRMMRGRGRGSYEGSVVSGTEKSFRRSLSPVRSPRRSPVRNPNLSLSGVLQGALDIDELLSDDSTEGDDDSLSDSHHALYLAASQQRSMMEAAFQRHSAENDTQVKPSSSESHKKEEQKRRESVEATTLRRMSVELITSIPTKKKGNEEKEINLRLSKLPKAKHAMLSTMKKPASFRIHGGIPRGKKNDLKGRINKKTLVVVGFILLVAGIILTTVLIIIFGKTVGSGNAKDVSTSFLRSSYDRP